MEVLKLETWERLFDPEVINLDKVQEYLDFIVEARDRYDPERYSEWHHILPRCLDPDKKFRDQGVQINGRDHFLAHLMLVDCFEGLNKSKLSYAVIKMKSQVSSRGEEITPEEWETAREKFSDSHKGSGNPRFGSCHSQETREKMSLSMRGNTNRLGDSQSEETRKKISMAVSGEKNGCYGRDQSGSNNPMFGKPAWNRGRKWSEEARRKMSESQRRRYQREREEKGVLA